MRAAFGMTRIVVRLAAVLAMVPWVAAAVEGLSELNEIPNERDTFARAQVEYAVRKDGAQKESPSYDQLDGGYSPFTDWSTCSKSCGGGWQLRSRTCTNPLPSRGGKGCENLGAPVETVPCMTQPCPINGGYTEWTSWSECSSTCEGGERMRSRECTSPTPQYGGVGCDQLGPPEEMETCNFDDCSYGWPFWPYNFAWSSAGPIPGWSCIQIFEGTDPNVWADNYFCWTSYGDPGFRWSTTGPIEGLKCTQIKEVTNPDTGDDKYLCVNPKAPYKFYWSSLEPPMGTYCLNWTRPEDPHAWRENKLCAPKYGYYQADWPLWPLDFAWRKADQLPGWSCLLIPDSNETQSGNHFCWLSRPGWKDPGLRWSNAGPIWGMRCTQLLEVTPSRTWDNNYLCVPYRSPYRFYWSGTKPVLEYTRCIKWMRPVDPNSSLKLCA